MLVPASARLARNMKLAPSAGRVTGTGEESWLNFDPFTTSFLRVMGNRKSQTDRCCDPTGISMPILFHPDFNRRPRNHTGSADPRFRAALAGLSNQTGPLTAGGEFHPALRTSSPQSRGDIGKIGAAGGRCNEAQRCARSKADGQKERVARLGDPP